VVGDVQGSETQSLVEALEDSLHVIQTLETLTTRGAAGQTSDQANMTLLQVLQRGVTAGEVAGMISGAASIGELC
jgi:hypothetical protein